MRSYLLLLRFAVVNVAALAILAAAWLQGWVGLALESDVTHLTLVIAGVFVAGLAVCTAKVWHASHELNAVHDGAGNAGARVRWYRDMTARADGEARPTLAGCLRSRLYARIAVVRQVANSLVLLGLIGTVVGFIIALSGLDPAAATDVGAVAPMVSTLIEGMAVALYTTLVGSVFHVWLLVNYQLLATGTVNLANAIIERAEAPEPNAGAAAQAAHA